MTTTRKHPRTLQEAFGPYTSREIVNPTDRADRIVVVGCLAAVAFLALIVGIF